MGGSSLSLKESMPSYILSSAEFAVSFGRIKTGQHMHKKIILIQKDIIFFRLYSNGQALGFDSILRPGFQFFLCIQTWKT